MSLYWIDSDGPGGLAITPRPRTGDGQQDEIAGWRAGGVDIVVSLLKPAEVEELGLSNEPELCRRQGMRFVSFPIGDFGVPSSTDEVLALARSLAASIADGKKVAIHCRAGIGRSGTVAACVLACRGIDADTAFAIISRARAISVPETDEQRQWVVRFSERLTQ